ncbi:Bromodomain-containing protein 4A [Frankliniella fusca]|uniref:Bromodomain-containing protein 4A n=1 Tax=Frankliniella fusca TaxID=407009 RepID=A0AAE1HF62_9NEOP|nr:Bromodomain-containing protein 4A [Frankliniella fusca]
MGAMGPGSMGANPMGPSPMSTGSSTMMGPGLTTSLASSMAGLASSMAGAPLSSPAMSGTQLQAPSQGSLGPGPGPGAPLGTPQGQGPHQGAHPALPTSMSMGHSHSNGYSPMPASSNVKMESGLPHTSNGSNSSGGPGPGAPGPTPMPSTVPSLFDPPSPDVKREDMSHGAPHKNINDNSLNHNSLPYMERTITPPDMNNSKPPAVGNFASAFKSKDIKNASSWSSLAQSSSPQNSMLAANRSADVFQAFKKQAKQNSDRQKAIQEQQEIRRQQKELAEKERMRQENEKRRGKEEEEALEKARKSTAEHILSQPSSLVNTAPAVGNSLQSHTPPTRVDEVKMSNDSMSLSPGNPYNMDNAVAERERQRKREQERRRREAMAGQIDMNKQSELMAAFEESL